ncbi:MAG: PilZ domain-containing protein, partial [Novosphingobium sp.]
MPITTGNNAIVLDGPQAIEADDRRAASRFTLLIRAGKLVSGDLELPCVVRDASQSGIKLKVFNALPSDGPIDLELANGERFSVEPVWARDGHAGFRFTDDVDLPRLLDAERGPFRSRKLRLRTAIQGRVGCGSQIHPATLENISQQ